MELHRRVLPFFISFPPVYCHFLSFSLSSLSSRVRKVKVPGEAVRLLLLPSISISRSSKRTSHNQRSWSWLKSREYLGLGSSSARSPLLYNFFESDCRNPPLPLPVPCINQKNIKTLPSPLDTFIPRGSSPPDCWRTTLKLATRRP